MYVSKQVSEHIGKLNLIQNNVFDSPQAVNDGWKWLQLWACKVSACGIDGGTWFVYMTNNIQLHIHIV